MTIDISRATGASLFVFGLILNQGMPADRAWQMPEMLASRLGGPELWRFADEAAVAAAMCAPPALHRFPRMMADRITLAARRIGERWSGDARRIWTAGNDADAVLEHLRSFAGVGGHKALVGLFVLTRQHGVGVRRGAKPLAQYAHRCPGLVPALPLLGPAE